MNSKLMSKLIGVVSMLVLAGANGSSIFVDPAVTTVTPGATFTASVMADFSDVGGASKGSFTLTWDPAQISINTQIVSTPTGNITVLASPNGPDSSLPSGTAVFFNGDGFSPFTSGTLSVSIDTCGFSFIRPCSVVGGATGGQAIFDLAFTVATTANPSVPITLAVPGINADQWTDGFQITPFTNQPSFTGATVTVSSTGTVPVPPAVWLFGSGLIGLAGVARQRRTTRRVAC